MRPTLLQRVRTGRVVEGSNGMLYGTTVSGGSANAGTVYRVNKDGSDFSVIKSLNGGSEGANTYSKLAEGSDGSFYGTTTGGGAFGAGTIYRINRDGSGFAVLLDFLDPAVNVTGCDGLTEGSDGLLYGMGAYGGGVQLRGGIQGRQGWQRIYPAEIHLLHRRWSWRLLSDRGKRWGSLWHDHVLRQRRSRNGISDIQGRQ